MTKDLTDEEIQAIINGSFDVLKIYSIDYELDGETYSISLAALDEEDALRRLEAIKATGEVYREINLDSWKKEDSK